MTWLRTSVANILYNSSFVIDNLSLSVLSMTSITNWNKQLHVSNLGKL